MAEACRAQSDDCYSRIAYLARDGGRADGTIGWREGAENRVDFQVWDGPSFATLGDDLAAAFAAARAGIIRAGFTPLAPEDGGLDDMFSGNAVPSPPRVLPRLWLLAAAILAVILIPAFARAAVPEYGVRNPFPNVPYDWRYEGPDYDTRAGGKNAAARLRHEARERGDPDWHDIPLDPVIAILKRGSGRVVARYRLEGGQFCDYEDDNCDFDGIFPIVLPTMKDEPVLGVVRHIGAHGQKLSILRPLRNRKTPVFEAVADHALSFRLSPERLDITVDHALPGGAARQEHLHWPEGAPEDTNAPPPDQRLPDVTLPSPPALTPPAAAFEAHLHKIAATRDLDAFTGLLADDVLVSFGGEGGRGEFVRHWRLDSHEGRKVFWEVLESLLSHGGWNEAGGSDDDGQPYPQRLTFPWFFAAWPKEADAENIFIADADARLRAAPANSAPAIARLTGGTVLHGRVDEGDEALEWVGHGWLEVIAPSGLYGFVDQQDVTPLLETRMIAVETTDGWRIEAMVAGD